jgi:3-phytase
LLQTVGSEAHDHCEAIAANCGRLSPKWAQDPVLVLIQGGANATHRGNPAFDTADFADTSPGNLRADYVLPDRGIAIKHAFVFWPRNDDPLFPLVGLFNPALLPDGNGFPSSDHRLVAADLKLGRRH